MPEIWRVPAPWLEQAQDDATLLAIRDMERAGIDIITDGEMRRESYSNRFATALDGVDIDNPAKITGRSGTPSRVPRITGSRSPTAARTRSRSRRRNPGSISAC
jgi:5-methyltetrahydropteroyltriglutamate--homocysteine methyltransferase